jgi:hypothetical protein
MINCLVAPTAIARTRRRGVPPRAPTRQAADRDPGTESRRLGSAAPLRRPETPGRFCSAAFLLAWAPGSSFYKFGPDYSLGELTSDPPIADAPLGRPLVSFRIDDGLLVRDFEHGTVVLNPTAEPRQITPHPAGAPVVVGGSDATVLVGSPG